MRVPMCRALVGWALVGAAATPLAVGMVARGHAQQPPSALPATSPASGLPAAYASLPTEVGPGVAPRQLQPSDVARRARVVARAGDVTVTIGEVEDHLLTALPTEQEAFRSAAGRRGVVDRLLRFHLLAVEARSRGAVDETLEWSAARAEARALRLTLEEEIRRDPGPLPAPPAPVDIPEQRFGVVFYAESRQTVQAWIDQHRSESFHDALAHGQEMGTAVQTPYGERDRQGEGEAIEAALWRELFRLPPPQGISPPVRVGRRWAAVMLAGVTGGYVDQGPDEDARRLVLADQVWEQLRRQVRADRVRALDPSALDGVAFRLPNQSPAAQRRLQAELEAQQRASAATEAP